MALTELECRKTKGREKSYKLFDGKGLYLEVMPNGRKYWRLKFRHLGKENRMSLGVYGPDADNVSLAKAREKATEARALLKHEQQNPIQRRQEERKQAILESQSTLEVVAHQWFELKKSNITQQHAKHTWRRLELDVFPFLGHKPMKAITSQDIIEVMKRIDARGAHELARRMKQIMGEVFRYAVTHGLADNNPASTFEARDVLPKYEKTHYAAIDSKRIPVLLAAMNNPHVRIYPITRFAVQLLMLTFVRPNELAQARWDEFDLEGRVWNIPAERMKMRRPHVVPLCEQAVAILQELKTLTGHRAFVFPNQKDPRRPMSNNTILKALAAMGFKGEMTGHGFRSLAMSTIKEKLGYRHEVIDLQLAHAKKDKIQAAYDRADFMDERTEMMQAWADYLDAQSKSDNVVHGKFDRKAA